MNTTVPMDAAVAMDATETLEQLTEIGNDVVAHLGTGHREAVYQVAIATALAGRFIPYSTEVCCPFMYRRKCVGYGKADIVVHNIIVELKVSTGASNTTTNANMADARTQVSHYVDALSVLEKQQYIGVVMRVDKHTQTMQTQAIDTDGDVIFDSFEDGTPEKDIQDEHTKGVDLMCLFNKRYKLVSCMGARDVTKGRKGIPLHRLTEYLSTQLTTHSDEDKITAIAEFLKTHFTCKTVSKHSLPGTSKRQVVCYPVNGARVVLV
eukprot:3125446-Rhodomonas_salina.2